MGKPAYIKGACRLCDKVVSTAWPAYTAHMRKHVREGLATEGVSSAYGIERASFTLTEAGQQKMKEAAERRRLRTRERNRVARAKAVIAAQNTLQ